MISISFGLMMVLIGLDLGNTAGKWVLPSALVNASRSSTPFMVSFWSRFGRRPFWRKNRVNTSWDEVASSLAFQVRAGKTLVQAVDSVSKEGSSGAHKRLAEAYRLYETGVPISKAMEMTSGDDEELSMIAGVFEIGSLSGGNTAVLLWHVFEILRRRRIFRGEVKARLSETRITARILLILPWLIGSFMIRHDPSLLLEFASFKEGRLLLIVAFALWFAGMILIMVCLRSVSSYAAEGRVKNGIWARTRRRWMNT